MRLYLQFSSEQGRVHQARLDYAFRVFCAIYGHEPVRRDDQAESADVRIQYAPGQSLPGGGPSLRLSNLYRVRPLREPAPPPRQYVHDGEALPVFYMPFPGEQPDWLAEIFEWISCADEYSIAERDSVGRIPFAASYMGRHNLDVRVPYAALAMQFLQRSLCELVPEASVEPPSPLPGARHFVVLTHDVDYLPVSRFNGISRLIKNAAVSCIHARRPLLGAKQALKALWMAAGGSDPMDQISNLAHGESERGIDASYYFLIERLHRRDANYALDHPGLGELMRSLEVQGLEVGVHGSYTSLECAAGLGGEYARLRHQGFHPQGGRQHWLRFTLDRLIPALERAGAVYDTSLAWSERIGYRAGACFAFPPYNFERERPATFLEIPMAIMDQTLQEARGGKAAWFRAAAELLAASRRYGWGGISLLWHPAALGGGWFPAEAGNILWRLLDRRPAWNDTWLSAKSFVESVRERFAKVGLLSGVPDSGVSPRRDQEVSRREMAAA